MIEDTRRNYTEGKSLKKNIKIQVKSIRAAIHGVHVTMYDHHYSYTFNS